MAETAVEAIFHPVRMRIITALNGQQQTTAQLAAVLPDVAQATLYRHLKRLLDASVICVVAQRPVRGVLEKVYALTGSGLSLTPDSPEIEHFTNDDWRRAFAAFTGSLLGQFETCLRQEPADLAKDGVSFRTAPLHLSDAETLQFFADLRALISSAGANGPAPDRRRRLFSTILIPETNPDEQGDTE